MKIVDFIPCVKSMSNDETFNLVMREVFQQLLLHNISCKLSFSNHPQTDGQNKTH